MVKLATWAGKSNFSYSGSVKEGTVIIYGANNRIRINAADYRKLLLHFKGRTLEIGTSRDRPPRGSMGEWLQNNITKTAIASYIGPILIHEGYAEKANDILINIKMYTCKELVKDHKNVGRINLNRFYYLHPDGRDLILSWYRRAKTMCDNSENHFEAFIYAWIAFNGWAACVTGIDADRKWLDALMLDKKLSEKYNSLVERSNKEHHEALITFSSLWPIFKAQEIRRRGVRSAENDRVKLIKHYFSEGIKKYEPQCYKWHLDNNLKIPLDWPHTLATLYRVRCNLFHGEKARDSENDHLIVSAAFKVLISIETEIFIENLVSE